MEWGWESWLEALDFHPRHRDMMLCGSLPIQEGAALSLTCIAGDRRENQALKQPKPNEERGLEEHCLVAPPGCHLIPFPL